MNKIALQQKLPSIALFILIVAMVSALSIQAYYFFTPINTTPEEIKAQLQSPVVERSRPQRSIDELTLFGTPPPAGQQEEVAKTEDLPETNLRLILRGVSASSDIEHASALIEGPDKSTLKYSINDTLPGNAKLKSVYEKRIVIERNGRLENLYFPDDASIGIVSNEPTENTNQTPSRTTPFQQIQAPPNYTRPAAKLDTLSEQRKQEIKDRLEELRERMKQSQQ